MIEILAALAVARVSIFIVRERAPFGIMEKIRAWAGSEDVERYLYLLETGAANEEQLKSVKPRSIELAKLLSCVWCISLWVGLIACLLLDFPLWYALPFSAVAIAYDEKIS